MPVYLRTLYNDRPRLQRLAVVYTVHNVGYQGLFSSYDLPLTGLGWELLSPKALEFYGKLNFMKGGPGVCRPPHHREPPNTGKRS